MLLLRPLIYLHPVQLLSECFVKEGILLKWNTAINRWWVIIYVDVS